MEKRREMVICYGGAARCFCKAGRRVGTSQATSEGEGKKIEDVTLARCGLKGDVGAHVASCRSPAAATSLVEQSGASPHLAFWQLQTAETEAHV